MAKNIRLGVKIISGKHRGEEVVFMLRQPTTDELSTFKSRCGVYLHREDELDLAGACRAELFDLLLNRVENLYDEDGQPITVDLKDKISPRWKINLIFGAFEYPKGISILKKTEVCDG